MKTNLKKNPPKNLRGVKKNFKPDFNYLQSKLKLKTNTIKSVDTQEVINTFTSEIVEELKPAIKKWANSYFDVFCATYGLDVNNYVPELSAKELVFHKRILITKLLKILLVLK